MAFYAILSRFNYNVDQLIRIPATLLSLFILTSNEKTKILAVMSEDKRNWLLKLFPSKVFIFLSYFQVQCGIIFLKHLTALKLKNINDDDFK